MTHIKEKLNAVKIASIDALILALNSCEIDKTEDCYLSAMRRVDIPLVEWE